jgi:ABC-2 type transport system permease protein
MTFLAFWTTRVWAIANVYMAVYALASGEFVPLDLLPSAMQSIARILPYQLTLYFPTQLVLGKISIAAAFGQMGLQLAWVIGLGLIFRWMWKAGVKRFSAVGA